MDEDEKIRKQLNDYCLNNFEIIEKTYSDYLEMVKTIKIETSWIWGKEQFAAMMIVTEEKHAHLVEWMEFELEKKGIDPFATPKASSYIIAKNENGSIVLIYTRVEGNRLFRLQLMPSNIMEMIENNEKLSMGTKSNVDDFSGEGSDLYKDNDNDNENEEDKI
jgi:hypothetical protein